VICPARHGECETNYLLQIISVFVSGNFAAAIVIDLILTSLLLKERSRFAACFKVVDSQILQHLSGMFCCFKALAIFRSLCTFKIGKETSYLNYF